MQIGDINSYGLTNAEEKSEGFRLTTAKSMSFEYLGSQAGNKPTETPEKPRRQVPSTLSFVVKPMLHPMAPFGLKSPVIRFMDPLPRQL